MDICLLTGLIGWFIPAKWYLIVGREIFRADLSLHCGCERELSNYIDLSATPGYVTINLNTKLNQRAQIVFFLIMENNDESHS